jgi:DNA-binding transcriptional LysR family regulator
VYTADDLVVLKCAVLQGTGISVLPDYLCSEELRRGELVPVLPGWRPPWPGCSRSSRRGAAWCRPYAASSISSRPTSRASFVRNSTAP